MHTLKCDFNFSTYIDVSVKILRENFLGILELETQMHASIKKRSLRFRSLSMINISTNLIAVFTQYQLI